MTRKLKINAEVHYHDCLAPQFGNNVPAHTTRVPPVGFELATNGIQFCAIANLDKTSLKPEPYKFEQGTPENSCISAFHLVHCTGGRLRVQRLNLVGAGEMANGVLKLKKASQLSVVIMMLFVLLCPPTSTQLCELLLQILQLQ